VRLGNPTIPPPVSPKKTRTVSPNPLASLLFTNHIGTSSPSSSFACAAGDPKGKAKKPSHHAPLPPPRQIKTRSEKSGTQENVPTSPIKGWERRKKGAGVGVVEEGKEKMMKVAEKEDMDDCCGSGIDTKEEDEDLKKEKDLDDTKMERDESMSQIEDEFATGRGVEESMQIQQHREREESKEKQKEKVVKEMGTTERIPSPNSQQRKGFFFLFFFNASIFSTCVSLFEE
jgi:hypothetical protein